MTDTKPEESNKPKGISPTTIIILVVVALFAGVMFAKTQNKSSVAPVTASSGTATGDAGKAGGTTITSVHNDAVADYEAALKAGKPIYVLFHSLS